MSIVNLLGNTLTQFCKATILIGSSGREEATSRGIIVDDAVGELLKIGNETLKVIPYGWNIRTGAHGLYKLATILSNRQCPHRLFEVMPGRTVPSHYYRPLWLAEIGPASKHQGLRLEFRYS